MLEEDNPSPQAHPSPNQPLKQRRKEIEYPESDGHPMAESDAHLEQMVDALMHPLKERYRDNPDVYVSGGLFIYYQEGNPQAAVAPDVFVVFGAPKHRRRIYKVWEEARAPDVIFELTSRRTFRADLREKRLLYEELGVREYFLFDPLHEYLQPPLEGFRLKDNHYLPLIPKMRPSGEWELESELLGLTLHTDGPFLRLYDSQQGGYLLSRAEEAEARRRAEDQLAQEVEARRALEEEVARLRELLNKKRDA